VVVQVPLIVLVMVLWGEVKGKSGSSMAIAEFFWYHHYPKDGSWARKSCASN